VHILTLPVRKSTIKLNLPLLRAAFNLKLLEDRLERQVTSWTASIQTTFNSTPEGTVASTDNSCNRVEWIKLEISVHRAKYCSKSFQALTMHTRVLCRIREQILLWDLPISYKLTVMMEHYTDDERLMNLCELASKIELRTFVQEGWGPFVLYASLKTTESLVLQPPFWNLQTSDTKSTGSSCENWSPSAVCQSRVLT
jgi:hypothetical protein